MDRTFTYLLTVLLAAHAVMVSADTAVIHVSGDKPLTYDKFRQKALINENRAYVFENAPEHIIGLNYTLPLHRDPAKLNIKVEKGGTVYVCFGAVDPNNPESIPTPENLELEGDWKAAGTMKTVVSGASHTWKIFSIETQAGTKLSIPPANRWGSIVLAGEIKGLKQHGVIEQKTMQSLYASFVDERFNTLQKEISARHFCDNERLEKEVLYRDSLILESDMNPVDVIIRRTAALLDRIGTMQNGPDMSSLSHELDKLRQRNKPNLTLDDQKQLFRDISVFRRRIAFMNPLLDFDKIIFLKHNKMVRGDRHMIDQYLGFNAEKKGGVYVLNKPFSNNPEAVSLLAKAPVQNGRLKGKILEDEGGFISLDLDYDGQTALFAFTEARTDATEDKVWDDKYWIGRESHKHYVWDKESTYNIFKMKTDGTDLQQLTDSPYNDYDPCFLPSGRIIFGSERNGGNQRCGGRIAPTAALHAMMADGSDVITLSWHDTNEWHPSVDNNGMIIYTRWDYVDRDSDIAHHIWHCFPDGRDPRSYHGNYPDIRESRPWMELSIRSIPNSHRYITVAAPHHGQAYGSLAMIDLRNKDDRSTSQLKRITPTVPFPESEASPGNPWPRWIKDNKELTDQLREGSRFYPAEVFGNPWPLSEDFYICVYSHKQSQHSICLADGFGNIELLYQDQQIGCIDPIPLKARTRPPQIPVRTIQAKADRTSGSEDLSEGIVTIMNIYESEFDWPEGTRIKELRIVNVFPKPNSHANQPNIGYAAQSLTRGVFGTVPVEEDGSVHFKMPTGCGVYFQAIDQNGLCVQSMKSDTYLHPGETLGCIGCHETKNSTPKNVSGKTPLAMKRPPSIIKPEAEGSYPLTFPRLVQPVLDAKCVECHDKEPKAGSLRGDKFTNNGWSEAFNYLRKYAWGKHGGNGALISSNKRSYSIPGQDGACASKLYPILKKGHYDVQLTPEEMRRITLWLDCNSNFYGAYMETEKQARGEIVKPVFGTPAWKDFNTLVR